MRLSDLLLSPSSPLFVDRRYLRVDSEHEGRPHHSILHAMTDVNQDCLKTIRHFVLFMTHWVMKSSAVIAEEKELREKWREGTLVKTSGGNHSTSI